jgi:hypothetical protein
MEAPPNFQRIAPQPIQVGREQCFFSEVLHATCSCDSTAAQVDESPPTCSPCSPTPLYAPYCFGSLLARLRLSAEVLHDLSSAVHVVKAGEMTLGKRLEAQPQRVQDRHGLA